MGEMRSKQNEEKWQGENACLGCQYRINLVGIWGQNDCGRRLSLEIEWKGLVATWAYVDVCEGEWQTGTLVAKNEIDGILSLIRSGSFLSLLSSWGKGLEKEYLLANGIVYFQPSLVLESLHGLFEDKMFN